MRLRLWKDNVESEKSIIGKQLNLSRLIQTALTSASAFIGVLLLSGCLSPIAIRRAVIEYDRTVSYVEADLLLLNIARARHHSIRKYSVSQGMVPGWSQEAFAVLSNLFQMTVADLTKYPTPAITIAK